MNSVDLTLCLRKFVQAASGTICRIIGQVSRVWNEVWKVQHETGCVDSFANEDGADSFVNFISKRIANRRVYKWDHRSLIGSLTLCSDLPRGGARQNI